jgi:predicted acetyltransferase
MTNPRIEIVPATLEQKPALANLLELYSYDFSEFIDLEIGPDGRFGYRDLDLYWKDPHRSPFIIYAEGKLAGFALVARMDEVMWDMTEFFIMRGFRRGGIGTRAAMEIFARLPGRWRVRVMCANAPACVFWTRAVHAFAGESVRVTDATVQGREWTVFSFASPPAS